LNNTTRRLPPHNQKFANMPSSQPKEGGIKGFLSRAGNSFYAGGMYCKEKSWVAARMAGNLAFIVATTSMVVLMPLIFEIMREGQVRFESTPCDTANSSILLKHVNIGRRCSPPNLIIAH
jgi:hypothetical protein